MEEICLEPPSQAINEELIVRAVNILQNVSSKY